MLFLVEDKECTIGNYRNYDSSSETVNCPTLTLVGLNDSNIQFKPLSLSFSNWTDFEFDDETGFSSSCPYRWKSKNGKLGPPSLSLSLSPSLIPLLLPLLLFGDQVWDCLLFVCVNFLFHAQDILI